jgi:hypothetical protein
MVIKQIKLEVCSPCQNDCLMCAHGSLRQFSKAYQLSLKQLERFLFYTKKSGYFIENLRIHGPGEPLLWKHLNQGLKMIHNSGVVGTIFIATNGHAISNINESSWEYIDEIRVSIYPDFKLDEQLIALTKKKEEKIDLINIDSFIYVEIDSTGCAPVPCICKCQGPMVYGDIIYLFCGPPLFEAVQKMKRDIIDFPELSSEIGLNYLEQFNEKLIGNLDCCCYCWANSNFNYKSIAHKSVHNNNW